jgi:hypothetical protein
MVRGVKFDRMENQDALIIDKAIASLEGEWRDIALGLSEIGFVSGSNRTLDAGLIGDSLPPGIVFGGGVE